MLIGVVVPLTLDPSLFGQQVDPVGTAAQGQFSKGGEVFYREKVPRRPLGLIGPINVSGGHTVQKIFGLDVHKFHLVCSIKDSVGDALADKDARDRGHSVVQALQVLDIDSSIDVDAGFQQLFHILIALCVAAAGGIGVGQFVHQDKLGAAGESAVNVEFPQKKTVLSDFTHRQLFQTFQKGGCPGTGMGLDIASHHVDPPILCLMGGLQHGIGLAHTG